MMTLLGVISTLFAAMPRDGRDYDGYLDLFSNKTEIQDIRNFEFISRLIYLISSLTDLNLGFIIFGAIACLYTIGVVKKSEISNFEAIFVFFSLTAAYFIMGYGYYLRQFVALTVIGYALLSDKSKWLHFAIAFGIHINTALMIIPVYFIYLLMKRYTYSIIFLVICFAVLTLLGIQDISSKLKLILSSYGFSYGWYFGEFEANPVARYLYNLLLYSSVAFFVIKILNKTSNKKILLPFSWMSFILLSEYLFSEFHELTNRISFALDFFSIIVLAKIISFDKRYSSYAIFLLILISVHGLKKGFDVL